MTANRKLGVGVVGLGIGEQHVRAFASLPDCQLRAIADLDATRADRLAQEFACETAGDFDSLIARDDVDIVSIASFDEDHFGQVTAALTAGKHVFVEKPLCRTIAELAEVRRVLGASGANLHLGSNLVLRGAAVLRWLREEIGNGTLGEVYAFDGDYLYGRLHKITDGWRKNTDGYSVMLGGGIHLIDLLLWLTGQRPRAVSALGNAISTRGTSFRYDDFVAATLSFESGLVARITANFGCVHRHQHVMRVFGTRGTFILDDAGPRFSATRDPNVPLDRLELAPLPESKGVLIPSFVKAITSGIDPDTPERRAIFDGISVASACDRALHTGAKEQVIYT